MVGTIVHWHLHYASVSPALTQSMPPLLAPVPQERSIVSNMAGTTRDAIDTDVTTPDGRAFKLVDTAGVRKRTAVAGSKDGAEVGRPAGRAGCMQCERAGRRLLAFEHR